MSANGPRDDERWVRSSLDRLAGLAPRAFEPPEGMLRRARRRVVAISVGAILVVGSVTFGGIALARALSERSGPPIPIGSSPAPTSGQHQTTPTEPTASAVPTPSQERVPVQCTFEPQPLPELPPPLRRVVAEDGSFQLADVDGESEDDVWIGGTVHGAFDKPAVTTSVVFHWDGSSMSVLPPLEHYGINSLDVLGPDDVWVSTSAGPLHWDGTAWSHAGDPVPADVVTDLAVSAAAPDDVWAVGTRPPGKGDRNSTLFAEHFDGTRWTETPVPKAFRGPFMGLWDVAATGLGEAWAVGGDDLSDEPGPPVIVHWNGASWQEVDGLPPAQAPYVGRAVSAARPDDVWVVAGGGGSNYAEVPSEVLHWDGSTWSRTTLPHASGAVLQLAAVDAAAPNDVWVAGAEFDPASGLSTPVVMHFDGVEWATVPLPVASAGGQGQIRAVREIGGQVWAVGFTDLHEPPFVSVCR